MSTSSPEPVPDPSSVPSPEAPATPDRGAPAPVARARDVADESRVRRAPRYGRFGLVGFLLGAAVSLGLTFVPVEQYDLSRGQLFLLLLLALGTAGVFVGLTVALLADRRSLRRRR